MKLATIDYRTINRLRRGQLEKRKRLILAACKVWALRNGKGTQ